MTSIDPAEPSEQRYRERFLEVQRQLADANDRYQRLETTVRNVLDTINSVVTQFSPDQPLEQLLTSSATTIRQTFNFPHVAIFTADETAKTLFKEAQSSDYANVVPLRISQNFDEGLIGYCAERRAPLYVDDVTAGDPLIVHVLTGKTEEQVSVPRNRYLSRVPDTRSELCSPIMVGDSLRGVLNIEAPRVAAFTRGLVEGFLAVCEHIGNVIEYATTVKQYLGFQRREELLKERLNLVLDLIGELNGSDLHAGDLNRFLQRLQIETQADLLVRYSVRRLSAAVLLDQQFAAGPIVVNEARSYPVPSDDPSNILHRAVRDGAATSKIRGADPALQALLNTDMTSFVVAPMRQAGTTTGLLVLLQPKRADTEEALGEVERTLLAVGNFLALFPTLSPR